jgi:hypothetical protein
MTNALATKVETVPAEPMPLTETAAIIAMIERAARDDTVNIDKMRELLSMRKQIITEAAEQKFNDAMAQAQSEMRAIGKDSNNPQTRSKYASYFALDKAVRPVYTKYGFALSFDTAAVSEQAIKIICHVSCCGFTRDYHIDMAADGKGAKGGDVMTKTHAIGSAISYGQRYLLKMIFNLATGDDDDGNNAGSGDKITEGQVQQLSALMLEVKADTTRFLKYLKIESLADLPANRFQGAIDALNAKRKVS